MHLYLVKETVLHRSGKAKRVVEAIGSATCFETRDFIRNRLCSRHMNAHEAFVSRCCKAFGEAGRKEKRGGHHVQ